MQNNIRILAVGDVVSEPGCEALRKHLPLIKKQNNIDFCIANGENSAVGNGITPHSANYLFDSGVDFITTGNHAFRRKEMFEFFDEKNSVIRPANFFPGCPGRGYEIVDLGFTKIAVINLSGMAYMDRCDNPFHVIDNILYNINHINIKVVDFHAEATAEKEAMGFYLDGRVSAVFGTHTHVMTADARILKGGTGYITDLGMSGVRDSVLGVDKDISISWLKTGMPTRFDAAKGECIINGCIFEIDIKSGKCAGIYPISVP